MIKTLSLLALSAICIAAPAQADADEDEIVRLPGQGEVRDEALRKQAKSARLKPGAGLLISFDEDRDGRISQAEVEAGIPVAFEDADANEDGSLTAFEQQDWAESLPTRDDSLANPFRFDPNLDRRVDLDEFTMVIVNLAEDYADEESGDIVVADLKAPRPRDAERGQGRGERPLAERRPRGERS
ncbi:MAG: hypothetical protein AAFY82_04355 [Pseudomonadota bacterium]